MYSDINMECCEVLELLQKEFNSLWNCRKRGNTIEIITPFTTITQNFVSVFITKRNGAFIVSDGGWIQSHLLEILGDNTFEEKNKVLGYFMNHHKIQSHEEGGKNYFFKSNKDGKMLSALSYDMAQFISNTMNALYSTYELEMQEYEGTKRFDTQVNETLKSKLEIGGYDYASNCRALDDLKIQFSSCVRPKGKERFTIIMCVSGSSPTYFSNSVARANQNFEVAKRSKYKDYFKSLSILNDQADGYKSKSDLGIYLENLKDKSDIMQWSEFNYNKFKEFIDC